jgi:signal transduction histidine kinase
MTLARSMRLIGWVLYFASGVIVAAQPGPAQALHAWLAGYAALGVAYLLAGRRASPTVLRVSLAVQSAAVIVMAASEPCRFSSLMLILIAAQAAMCLRTRLATAWLFGLSAAVLPFLHHGLSWSETAAWGMALVCIQAFSVVTVHMARAEADAREALAETNAALLATRAELAAQSRERERLRIARDLHDVIGHDLTALGLQLEVARNIVTEPAAKEHVERAKELSTQLLTDVRGVVSAMRERREEPLLAVLEAIAESMAGLTVHLPEGDGRALLVAAATRHPERIECLVRCVQELVTNTARHAGAEHLWITARASEGSLELEAHDDGRVRDGVSPGSGLRGMAERLAEHGGALQVEHGSDDGVRFVVRIPMSDLDGPLVATPPVERGLDGGIGPRGDEVGIGLGASAMGRALG